MSKSCLPNLDCLFISFLRKVSNENNKENCQLCACSSASTRVKAWHARCRFLPNEATAREDCSSGLKICM